LTAALLRMAPLPKFLWPIQNKYVIWTIMYGIIGQVRPIFLSGENVPPSSEVLRSVVTDLSKMRIIVATLFTVVILSCYIKIQSGYYPKNVKEAKQQIKKQL
jgi:hypothetical protein